MTPAQVQQIEREIAHLEDRARHSMTQNLGHHVRNSLRAEVRRKWLMIKPFVTADQICIKDAARNG